MKTIYEANRQDIEEIAVQWRAKRADRLSKQRETDLLEKEEKELKRWLIAAFREQHMEGVIVGGRTTGVNEKEIPIVEDREALCNYILQTGKLELLQFRLSTTAAEELIGNG